MKKTLTEPEDPRTPDFDAAVEFSWALRLRDGAVVRRGGDLPHRCCYEHPPTISIAIIVVNGILGILGITTTTHHHQPHQ